MQPKLVRSLLVLAVLIVAGVSLFLVLDASQNEVARIEPLSALAKESEPPKNASNSFLPEEPLRSASSGREVVESAPATAPYEASPSEIAAQVETVLRGRCIDGLGSPVRGAEVKFAILGTQAMSGPDGRFVLKQALSARLAGSKETLHVTNPGYVRREIEVELSLQPEVDLGDIVLDAAGRVSGFVYDTEEQTLAGMEVLSTAREALHFAPAAPQRPDRSSTGGVTNASGAFALGEVPVGDVRIWAGEEGWAWTYIDVTVSADEELRVDLHVRRMQGEEVIEILVLDPDGKPLPNASISYQYRLPGRSSSGSVKADENGRCRHVLGAVAPHDYLASAPNHDLTPTVARAVEPGTNDLVMQLAEPKYCELRIVDLNGKSVDAFHASVMLVNSDMDLGSRYNSNGASKSSGSEAASDRVRIVVPPELFLVSIEAEGFEVGDTGSLEPSTVGDVLEISLKALPGIAGRVLNQAGEPVVGASVSLQQLMGEKAELTVNGFNCRSRNSSSMAQTDAVGEFLITLRESGAYLLRAEAKGMAPSESGPFDLVAEVGKRGLDLTLSSGGRLEGQVIGAPSESVSGVIVGLSRGDGHGLTQVTDAEGRYAFELLTPGLWWLERRNDEISPYSTTSSSGSSNEPFVIPSNCEVWEGRTTQFNLDVSKLAPVVLEGSLKFNGQPQMGMDVTLESQAADGAGQKARARETLDAQGHFQLELEKPGEYQLWVHGWSGGVTSYFMEREFTLVLGVNEWHEDISTAKVEGTVALQLVANKGQVNFRWEDENGFVVSGNTRPKSDGTYAISNCPTGSVKIWLTSDGAAPSERTIAVQTGAVAQVHFP